MPKLFSSAAIFSPPVEGRARRLGRTGAEVLTRLRAARRSATETAPAPEPEGDLRVASYNVHKCVGTDRRFDPARVAHVIGELGADLVALQEVDRRFGRRIGLLNVEMLEHVTGLTPLRVSDLPDGLGWHGNAVLVRPGTQARIRRIDLPGAEPRGAVVAELALGCGRRLRVIAAHFGLLRRCRARQGAAILEAITQSESMPTLLLGDLNEWRPGPRSALRSLEPVFGPLSEGVPSFPARLPLLALDRIIGCPRARILSVAAHDTPLARLASDHLPLKAVVRLEAEAALSVAA